MMKEALLDSAEATQFREAARHYCALIERGPSISVGEFLLAVEPVLALLYYAAASLPDIAPASDGREKPHASTPGSHGVEPGLQTLLGEHNHYSDVFDPVDVADRDSGVGSLWGDLAEIYDDLREALALETSSRQIAAADILWDWRFAFTSHWGRHAASALRVVNSLLHTHFVQALSDSADA